jgi:PST family polysaccharide transporter
MIKTIQTYLKNEEYKRLFDNFMSLMTLQGLNYILPLITFPYLVRVLGPEKFGLVSFASAFIGYFVIISDYGFNLSATREIAINRENNEKLSEIFSSVMIIKFILMILSFFLMLLIVFSFDKFKADWKIYIFTFGIVFGNFLFPVWFFQGMEKMRFITYLNILSKLVFTVLIFLIIKNSADFIYVPLINSMGYVLAGILSLMVIIHHFRISFTIPNFNSLHSQLQQGKHIFISSLSGNLYGQGTTFILGLTASNEVIGYYSVAERLAKSIACLSQPIAQSIYPYFSKLRHMDFDKYLSSYKKLFRYSLIFSAGISLLTLLFSKKLYILISGYYSTIGINSLRIWSIALFFTFLNVILSPMILSLNMDRYQTTMYIFVGISFLLVCYTLSYFFGAIGTSFTMLLVESLIFIGSILIINRGVNNAKQ